MTDNNLRESLRNLVDAAEAVLDEEPHGMAALRMASIAAQLDLEGPPAPNPPLAVGELVSVAVRRCGKITDADPPEGLEGFVQVKIPGEIPERWWVNAHNIERGTE